MQETRSPAPDILVTGHFKEEYGYSVYRWHGSGNWLVSYTIQGKGLYRQHDLRIWAQPGDLVLLQPGALHDYSVPEGETWEFLWAHFQPRVSWLSWWQLPDVGQGLYKIHIESATTQARIQQAFLRLHADASSSATFKQKHPHPGKSGFPTEPGIQEEPLDTLQRELALNGLETVMLLAVRDNIQRNRRTLDPRIQQVLDLVMQDLTRHYELTTLAQEVSLSPSRLSHLFKQEVGDSVTNMIISLRLRHAARLLEFSTHSISTIAEEVGFGSAYYFSRQFHQRFGLSPRQYRDKMLVGTHSENDHSAQ